MVQYRYQECLKIKILLTTEKKYIYVLRIRTYHMSQKI